MITTTLGALIDAEPALRRVCALPLRSKESPEGLTPRVKYHLAKLARLVAVETRHFTTEQALLCETLGIRAGQVIASIELNTWNEYQHHIREQQAVAITLEWDAVKSTDLSLAPATDLVELGPLCDMIEPTE